MAARQGIIDDLIQIASRLPWQTGLLAAAGAGLVLHFLAVGLAPSVGFAGESTNLGNVASRGLVSSICYLLQFLVPAALAIGAGVSFVKRRQAVKLFSETEQEGFPAVQGMSWSQFEQLVGEAFRRRGYEVIHTGDRVADGGVDLILRKADRRYLVQCKHWQTRQVGVGAVRELNGVIAAQDAAGGYVITSGNFTKDARAFAQSCGIELIDGEGLSPLIGGIGSKKKEKAPRPTNTATSAPSIHGAQMVCPKCGGRMVQRVAKRGQRAGESFWGCSQYPACRGTRPMVATQSPQ